MAGLYPEAPGAPNYAAPLLDFSPIGGLANDFYKGAQNRLDYQRARAFPDGLPRTPDGQLDYAKFLDTMARHGDTSQLVPVSNVELDRQLIGTALRDAGMPGLGGAGGPAQSAGPAQASPARVMTPAPAGGPPAQVNIPAHGIPARSPNVTPGADRGTSVVGMVTDKLPEDSPQTGAIIANVSKMLGIDANAPLSAQQQQRVAQVLQRYSQPQAAPAAEPAPAVNAQQPVQPQQPGGSVARDPLADILPPGVTRENAPAFLAQLRRRAAALALSPRTTALAKQYEDQAKVIETALQPTPGQKEAYASGGMTPLQMENAKVVAKVTAENSALTNEQKLYEQAVRQGFKGSEMEFQATRELMKRDHFKVVRKDPNTGLDVYGWVDPRTQSVIEYRPQNGPADAPTLTGEPFLQTLDPGRGNQIKAVVEGRMAPPGGMSLKSPQIQALMRDAAQYEPGFDFTLWKSRNDTRADLAKGKMGQNVTAFNTAIGHLETLDKAAEELKNRWNPTWNKIANFLIEQKGDPRVNSFNVAKTAVADELTRAFRGTGGNVHDLLQWEKAINSAGSPEQLKAAIKQAVELLRSRIEAVGEQYNRGMRTTTDPVELLSPKARKGIERLEGRAGNEPAPAAAAAPKFNSPEDVQKAIAAGTLKKGDVFTDSNGVRRMVP